MPFHDVVGDDSAFANYGGDDLNDMFIPNQSLEDAIYNASPEPLTPNFMSPNPVSPNPINNDSSRLSQFASRLGSLLPHHRDQGGAINVPAHSMSSLPPMPPFNGNVPRPPEMPSFHAHAQLPANMSDDTLIGLMNAFNASDQINQIDQLQSMDPVMSTGDDEHATSPRSRQQRRDRMVALRERMHTLGQRMQRLRV